LVGQYVPEGAAKNTVEEVTGKWRKLHNAELHGFTADLIVLGSSNKEIGGAYGT